MRVLPRRLGRGDRATREVLDASGAVTETFIERVAAQCDDLDGDGAALIEALHAGEVARFRANKAEELEAYFIDHGYTDPEPVLSPAVLWERMLVAAHDDLDRGVITVDDLKALLHRVTTCSTPPADDAQPAGRRDGET